MSLFASPDGRRLHVVQWPTHSVARAHGTVQIVHGLGEHIGRYAELAAVLNVLGWDVLGHDHWGHGRSEGPRGDLPLVGGGEAAGNPRDDTALLRDVAAVRDHARCPGRVVLLGHSLGGLLAARFVAEDLGATPAAWARGVDGLVLSSPALDIGMGALQRALLATLLPVAPHLPLGNGLKPQWICSNPAVVQAYVDDPLVHKRITPRLVRFMLDAAELVQSRAPLWRVPTLLQWAGADRCVRPAGSQAFAAAAPGAVLSAQPLAGFSHEIYNEPGREQAIARLRRWLAPFEAQNQHTHAHTQAP
jgi:alpha-beta hydrolase superfamily lysophospholipase